MSRSQGERGQKNRDNGSGREHCSGYFWSDAKLEGMGECIGFSLGISTLSSDQIVHGRYHGDPIARRPIDSWISHETVLKGRECCGLSKF